MMNSRKLSFMSLGVLLTLILLTGSLCSCDPEAKWDVKNVEITMTVENVSAGFIECSFETNKEAYYLIAIEAAQEGYNPMEHQKQFMMLAIDSANVEYLAWRNKLLRQGEFNIAPFASHALQYGAVNYIFTALEADTHYWIYAFVVNPETMMPVGRLHLVHAYTTVGTTKAIRFEYRVKGRWDYSYPMDMDGNILNHFPYVGTTRDSLEVAASGDAPTMYFDFWYNNLLQHPEQARIVYGVQAVENDGYDSYLEFQEGHTYYTYFSGFDGSFNHHVLYKFTWTEDYEHYFTEEESVLEENTGL